MQVDGEPCRLAPSLIRISLRNQANMVQKSKRRTSMPLLNEWVGYVHVLMAGGPFGAAYSVMDFACTGLAAHLQKKKKKKSHLLNSLSTVLYILTWFSFILLSSGLPSVLLLERWCIFQLFREVCAGSAVCLFASDSSAYVCHLSLTFFWFIFSTLLICFLSSIGDPVTNCHNQELLRTTCSLCCGSMLPGTVYGEGPGGPERAVCTL